MSTDLRALVDAHVSEEEVVAVCRDLVRAPSENPPGDEEAVASVSEAWLDRLGLTHERVTPAPGRPSVLSSWGGGDERTLLFNGHYDVVPVVDADAWPHPPFSAAIEDGKMYGRGTTDMKSGIAACLGAVAALQRAGFEPRGKVALHLVADEEALGTLGARYLVENGYCTGMTEALVGEPTSLHLVTSERGAVWLRVVTEGESAHGSTPQLGINAIEHMSHVVQALSGMRFRKLHPMLGAPTVNVGTIAGGSKVNTVPDRCVIEIDRRTLPGETTDEVLGEFERVLDEVRERVPGLRAHLELHDGAEPSETPEGTAMVALLQEAAEVYGVESSELGFHGATDARFLINQAKIPAVICGPGDLRLAHTTGEYVEIDKLVQATKMYAYAMARFLS
jgi:succinyl-diaminopimelate desuccinylase